MKSLLSYFRSNKVDSSLSYITKFENIISTHPLRPRLCVLHLPNVLRYLCDRDLFKTMEEEDAWGRETYSKLGPVTGQRIFNRYHRGKLKSIAQLAVKDIFTLLGHIVEKTDTTYRYQQNGNVMFLTPDWITDLHVIECNFESHQTKFNLHAIGASVFGDTAKYFEIPKTYNKPLFVVHIGALEYKYTSDGLFEENPSKEHKEYLDILKHERVYFIKFSDLVKRFVSKN